MKRHLAAATTACALAFAVPAAAQTAKPHAARRAAAPAAPQTVQLTGCLSSSGQPNEFSLAVMSNDSSSAATAQPGGTGAVGTTGTTSSASPSIAEGSQVQLVGDTQTLTQLANRKVQIKGTIVPQAASHSRNAAPAAAAGTRVRVERIERLSESCQPGGTAGTSGTTPAPASAVTPAPSPRTTTPSEPEPNSTSSTAPSSPATSSTPAAGAAPTTTEPSAAGESRESTETIINGLNSIEVQQMLGSVGPQNIASASDALGAAQVDALTQALEKNPEALKKAQELTTALQGRGLLEANERVVGVSGTTIYKVGQK